jgi:hypothetical protein
MVGRNAPNPEVVSAHVPGLADDISCTDLPPMIPVESSTARPHLWHCNMGSCKIKVHQSLFNKHHECSSFRASDEPGYFVRPPSSPCTLYSAVWLWLALEAWCYLLLTLIPGYREEKICSTVLVSGLFFSYLDSSQQDLRLYLSETIMVCLPTCLHLTVARQPCVTHNLTVILQITASPSHLKIL